MQVAKLSTKGQITIPKLVRELLQINEGDKVAFHIKDGDISIRKMNIEDYKIGENSMDFTQRH